MYDHPVQWYDHEAVKLHRGRHLPHFEQVDTVQFITFRLADSIPAERMSLWMARRDAWLCANPRPHTAKQAEYLKRIYTTRMHRYLDAGHGSCVLKQSPLRDLVEQTLRKEDGLRYAMGAFVIMPNHVHLLVQTDIKVRELVKQWKRITSHRINKAIRRTGEFWQSEPFDHIIRSAATLQRAKQYIADNPKCLPPRFFTLGKGTACW